ncbi:hypothetical protein [Parapedobacter sp.]
MMKRSMPRGMALGMHPSAQGALACLLRCNPLPHAPQQTEATPLRGPCPSFVGSLDVRWLRVVASVGHAWRPVAASAG